VPEVEESEVLEVDGFVAAGVHCGIKDKKPDLAILLSREPASAAGVFTRSTVVGAPVEWCRARARRGRSHGVVINSGISNVGMGARGKRDCAAMAKAAARAVGCKPEDLFVASTGVIGEPLPMAKIRRGVVEASRRLAPEGIRSAAEAIRTTDTYAKWASREVDVGGTRIRVTGIAKGSGMVEPDMATMLSFLFTDAAVAPTLLRRVLREVADDTYNRLTIDGETSTSDSVLLFAGGAAGNPPLASARSRGVAGFRAAVHEVAESLTRQLARDGEGATQLVRVDVRGARNAGEADLASRRIANSMLVKTALHGRDPNWGRILQTLGAGRITVRPEKMAIRLAGVLVFERGRSAGPAARRRAAQKMETPEVGLEVDLGAGRSSAHMWTCDLSRDYITINADYTT